MNRLLSFMFSIFIYIRNLFLSKKIVLGSKFKSTRDSWDRPSKYIIQLSDNHKITFDVSDCKSTLIVFWTNQKNTYQDILSDRTDQWIEANNNDIHPSKIFHALQNSRNFVQSSNNESINKTFTISRVENRVFYQTNGVWFDSGKTLDESSGSAGKMEIYAFLYDPSDTDQFTYQITKATLPDYKVNLDKIKKERLKTSMYENWEDIPLQMKELIFNEYFYLDDKRIMYSMNNIYNFKKIEYSQLNTTDTTYSVEVGIKLFHCMEFTDIPSEDEPDYSVYQESLRYENGVWWKCRIDGMMILYFVDV